MTQENGNKEKKPSSGHGKKKYSSLLLVVIVLLLACGGGFAAAKIAGMNKQDADLSRGITQAGVDDTADSKQSGDPDDLDFYDPDSSQAWGRRVEYNGLTYTKKSNLKTILFLGIDNATDNHGQVIGNSGRADSIILFVLDSKNKTIQMLSVSRDTIVNVDVYDTLGEFIYSGEMQLTMQYAFGNSAKRSCRLMQRRVGELIHGINLDGYFSITMDGLPVIIDGIGGLTLTMPEDYSDIDPAYTKDAVITMSGKEALRFIRYRDKSTLGSNNTRMDRDSWLISELFRQMHKGRFSISKLLDLADEYIETDLDGDTIKAFTSYSFLKERLTMPGTDGEGYGRDEYYVDDEALIPILLDLYYEVK